ncbi:caspase family protein [uncultured Roseibium sp.]|uniref:caspase family protein n=1 Tax=uncultured Roseibium sp. TaxID=1936171 RepID=UPI0032178009
MVLGSFLGLSVTESAKAADLVALVVGNGAYRHLPKLINSPNDATLMSRTLADLGFDVIEVIDGDQRALLDGLIRFGRATRAADIAMVFYAGHAVQVAGRNWLLPVDVNVEASTDLPGQAIRAEDLLDIMDASGARLKLVFLDACRNNPLPRSLTRGVARGLARLDADTAGTMIAFATAPGDVAFDGVGANSPFTTALARYIRQPGLEVRQMMGKVRKAVYDETGERQLPWVNEALIGEFYFAGRSQTKAAPTSEGSDASANAFTLTEKLGTLAAYDAFLSMFPEGLYADRARAARELLVAEVPSGEAASAEDNPPLTAVSGTPEKQEKAARPVQTDPVPLATPETVAPKNKPDAPKVIASIEKPETAETFGTSKTTVTFQRSILYEENAGANGAGTAAQGDVVWAVGEETDLNGRKQAVLTAKINIPDRDISVDLRMKPNDDDSLPASHLIEIKYNLPNGFPSGDVQNVPGLVLKPTEQARGDALIGASIKVSDGYFWIALSNLTDELERNIGLLRDRGWIDIPMLFDNGKRGILTLEKGSSGAKAVENAVQAWRAAG